MSRWLHNPRTSAHIEAHFLPLLSFKLIFWQNPPCPKLGVPHSPSHFETLALGNSLFGDLEELLHVLLGLTLLIWEMGCRWQCPEPVAVKQNTSKGHLHQGLVVHQLHKLLSFQYCFTFSLPKKCHIPWFLHFQVSYVTNWGSVGTCKLGLGEDSMHLPVTLLALNCISESSSITSKACQQVSPLKVTSGLVAATFTFLLWLQWLLPVTDSPLVLCPT